MLWPVKERFVLTVIALILAVIWPSSEAYCAVPVVESLGQLHEELSVPVRLDVDEAGNLYVADARRKAIYRFDRYGALAQSYTAVTVSGGGLAVSPDGSRLYAACGDAVAILAGDSGELLGYLGSGQGEFASAGYIDLDSVGYIFVADTQDRIVKVYDPQGVFAYPITNPQSATGKFPSIFALAVDTAGGELYVADSMRSSGSAPKMEVFDLSGQLQRTLSADNAFGPVLPFFGGISFDESGRGYFLDTSCSEIRVLTLPQTFSLRHQDSGGFGRWVDAAYDGSNKRLFVANEGGWIEIFGIDGGSNPSPPVVASNSPPSLPHPLSPSDGAEVTAGQPELTFQNSADADGDSLSYQVRLLQGTEPVAEYEVSSVGEETGSVLVDGVLEENRQYVWSVQASDGTDTSGWSETFSFYVNAEPEAPGVPALLAPADSALCVGQDSLSWTAVSDPDPADSVHHYVVELSAERSFAALVLTQECTGTSVVLADLNDYPLLEDGQTYYWRVRAVDQYELSSASSDIASFRYDTAILTVFADMPAARVYLGGNYAYSGRFVGEAPVEIRDLAPGACSVVVESPGFEPYLAQVQLAVGESVQVHAKLTTALVPLTFRAHALKADGATILLPGDAAPFPVDFDNDGLIDLLCGDSSGVLTLYHGVRNKKKQIAFDAAAVLELPLIYGASPFVVDWDNDGRKDLLIGAGDGTVRLYLNEGTEAVPHFTEGSYLQSQGGPLAVDGAAAPAVVDFDGDGDKDLVVGCGCGALLLYDNSGSDAAPQLAAARVLLTRDGPVVPFFTDWNSDGNKDLLLGTTAGIDLYHRRADGSFTAAKKLSTGQFPAANQSLHLFALDLNGQRGKDLIVGNSVGELFVLSARKFKPAASFWSAMRKQAKKSQLTRKQEKRLKKAIRKRKYRRVLALVKAFQRKTRQSSSLR
ncbi:MAG: FG-GAP-like repeat-containing protein [Desulfuromonadaceae bacterium]